jgi:cytoskeletal protein CcmA (bactofilin family)
VFKRRKPDEPQVPEPPPLPTAQPAVPAGDTGLGVPPFRPTPPKEQTAMSRAPFPGAPAAPPPAGVAPRPAPAAPPSRQPAERRTLVVGRGISVQGVVQDAERLVVEGTVESTTLAATELAVAHGGLFRGEVEVEDAEVAGTIDGTITARGSLVVRASGKVLGTARCRRLQVEDGGQITGRIEMITEAARPVEPARTSDTTV